MSTPTLCHTLRLELPVVAEWLSRKISALLQREIHCEATVDDYDYWALKCTNDRFSLADLSLLLAHVKASREIAIQAIPSDADSTCGIDLLLSNEQKAAALLLFHKYRYSDFELNKPFMPQFTTSINNLICELEKLVQG